MPSAARPSTNASPASISGSIAARAALKTGLGTPVTKTSASAAHTGSPATASATHVAARSRSPAIIRARGRIRSAIDSRKIPPTTSGRKPDRYAMADSPGDPVWA